MRLLLDEKKVIIAIGADIEFGVWGNIGVFPSWKISSTFYIIDDTYTVVEVNEIPNYVTPILYRYVNGEFVLAEEAKNELEKRIEALETHNAELTAQISMQNEAMNELFTVILPELYPAME